MVFPRRSLEEDSRLQLLVQYCLKEHTVLRDEDTMDERDEIHVYEDDDDDFESCFEKMSHRILPKLLPELEVPLQSNGHWKLSRDWIVWLVFLLNMLHPDFPEPTVQTVGHSDPKNPFFSWLSS